MCGSQLSSSTAWTPGLKLKSSVLLTKTYSVIYWRIFALWEDWAMSSVGKITGQTKVQVHQSSPGNVEFRLAYRAVGGGSWQDR